MCAIIPALGDAFKWRFVFTEIKLKACCMRIGTGLPVILESIRTGPIKHNKRLSISQAFLFLLGNGVEPEVFGSTLTQPRPVS